MRADDPTDSRSPAAGGSESKLIERLRQVRRRKLAYDGLLAELVEGRYPQSPALREKD